MLELNYDITFIIFGACIFSILGAPVFDAYMWQRVISSRLNAPVIKMNCPIYLLCRLREAGETEFLQS